MIIEIDKYVAKIPDSVNAVVYALHDDTKNYLSDLTDYPIELRQVKSYGEDDTLYLNICVCIKTTKVEFVTDYDFDENMIEEVEVNQEYSPIKFNPLTGEKFEFNVVNVYDKTDEVKNVLGDFKEIRKILHISYDKGLFLDLL